MTLLNITLSSASLWVTKSRRQFRVSFSLARVVLWGLTSYDNIFLYFSLLFSFTFSFAQCLDRMAFFSDVLCCGRSSYDFISFFLFLFSLLELVLLNASVKQSRVWASGPAGRLSDGVIWMRSWTGQCNVMRYVAVIPYLTRLF